MTIAEWLFGVMTRLGDAGVDSPRRDALVLLEDILGKDRSWVLAHPEYTMQDSILETLDELIERRLKREPLAYIRSKAWFYKRFFEVSPDVMIPRPESESFIELLKELVDSKQLTVNSKSVIADVGTGSGCLAITVKLEFPKTEVLAVDNSDKALKIAQKNAERHGVKIKFLQGSLLEPLQFTNSQFPTTILANLPYVPDNLVTSPEIEQEPPEALFSGGDGLDHYRKFWQEVGELEIKPRYILTESLENQHSAVAGLAVKAGYRLRNTATLVQIFES